MYYIARYDVLALNHTEYDALWGRKGREYSSTTASAVTDKRLIEKVAGFEELLGVLGAINNYYTFDTFVYCLSARA